MTPSCASPRKCTSHDLDEMFTIINDAAQAYKGVIPPDCWHEPYMSAAELAQEIKNGVGFWGIGRQESLTGIMGIQDKGDVALIRHAYVRTSARQQGIGTILLHHLETLTRKPILIGTWQSASWAIRFYEKNGYQPLSTHTTERLLKQYWTITQRQIETSIVLADKRWLYSQKNDSGGGS